MNIAILIPTYNGLGQIPETLRTLHEAIALAAWVSIDVVIVDDGSTDQSAAWIAANYPAVHMLSGSGSLWWSGSMNVAARYALETLAADYCVCWNDDILCATDYFVRLYELLRDPDHPVLLASKIYYLDRPDVIFAMGSSFDSARCRLALIGANEPDSPQYNQPRRVDWAPGMGTVIHRSVFEEIGFWDAAAFPQYDGDSDFGLRAKAAGIPMVARPELRIWNDKRTSGIRHGGRIVPLLRSFVRLNSDYHVQTRLRFVRRYAKSPTAYLVLLGSYVAYIGGFFKWNILGLIGIRRTKSEGVW